MQQQSVEINSVKWVLKELQPMLKDVQRALEACSEQSDGFAALESSINVLAQTRGTLQMVELYGAAQLADEMRFAAQALLDETIDNADSVLETLLRTALQLPDYLERLQAGSRDVPLVLLPLLNELREVRGSEPLTERDLFFPDLSAAPAVEAQPVGPLKIVARAQRRRFQRYLLEWLKRQTAGSLQGIDKVFATLEQTSVAIPSRRVWYIARALVEACLEGGLDAAQLKPFMGQLDRGLRVLVNEGEREFHAGVSLDLLKSMLYRLAQTTSSGQRVTEVRATYQLAKLLPDQEQIALAKQTLAGPNLELLAVVNSSIKEDISQIKDAIEIYVHSEEKALDQLQPLQELFGRVSDTVHMLGIQRAQDLLETHAEEVNGILASDAEISSERLMSLAGVLLSVEESLDDFVSQRADLMGNMVTSPGPDEKLAIAALPGPEFQALLSAVIREALGDLAKVRECMLSYLSNPERTDQIQAVPALLDQVNGAMFMLPLDKVVPLLRGLATYLRMRIIKSSQYPTEQQQNLLADIVAAIEYYLEAVEQGRGDMTHILHRGARALHELLRPAQEDTVSLATEPPLKQPQQEQPVSRDDAAASSASLTDVPAEIRAALTPAERPHGERETIAQDMPTEPRDATATRPSLSTLVDVPELDPEPEPPEPMPTVTSPGIDTVDAPALPVLGEDVDEEILEVFLEEAVGELQEISLHLPKWQVDTSNESSLVRIRRAFHTLKGSGRVIGAELIGEFAWSIENLLNQVIAGRVENLPEVFALLDEALGVLPQLIEQLRGNREPVRNVMELIARGHALANPQSADPEPPPPVADTEAAEFAIAQESRAAAALSADLGADKYLSEPLPKSSLSAEEQAIEEYIADMPDTEPMQFSDDDESPGDEIAKLLEDSDGVEDLAPPLAGALEDIAQSDESNDTLEPIVDPLLGGADKVDAGGSATSLNARGAFGAMQSDGRAAEPEDLQTLHPPPVGADEAVDTVAIDSTFDQLEALEDFDARALDEFALDTGTETDDALGSAQDFDLLDADTPEPVITETTIEPADELDSTLILPSLEESQNPTEAAGADTTTAATVVDQGDEFVTMESTLDQRESLDEAEFDSPGDLTQAGAWPGANQTAVGDLDADKGDDVELLAMESTLDQRESLDDAKLDGAEDLAPASTLAGPADPGGVDIDESTLVAMESTLDRRESLEDADLGGADDSTLIDVPDTAQPTGAATVEENADATLVAIDSTLDQRESLDDADLDGVDDRTLVDAEPDAEPIAGTDRIEVEEDGDTEQVTMESSLDQREVLDNFQVEETDDPELVTMESTVDQRDILDNFQVEEFADDEENEITLTDPLSLSSLVTPPHERPELSLVETPEEEPPQQPPSPSAERVLSPSDTRTLEQPIIDPVLLDIFTREAEGHIVALQQLVDAAMARDGVLQAREELVRGLHTLHGSAQTAEVQDIAVLSGTLERIAKAKQEQDASFEREETELIRDCLDCLARTLKWFTERGDKPRDLRELESQLRLLETKVERQSPQTPTDQDDELIAIFIEEGDELLENADRLLSQWRERPYDQALIADLQRQLHTLKGGARMANFAPIADLSHALETLVVKVTEQGLQPQAATFELLHEAVDALTVMLEQAREGQPVSRVDWLLDELSGSSATERVADGSAAAAERPSPTSDNQVEMPSAGAPVQEQIRVNADLLDNLVNYAGEVNIYQSRLGQQVTDYRFNLEELDQTVFRLRDQLRKMEMETEAQILHRYEKEEGKPVDEEFDPLELDRYSHIQELSRALMESVADLESIKTILGDLTRDSESLLQQQTRLSADLQDGLMRTRMVRFDRLSARLARVVRQTAVTLSKKADLEIIGGDTEIDRTVQERMIAPLEHMLRNAVSHGIELPGERRRLDKAPTGRITIELLRDGTDVLITVADDGGGINLQAIRTKAIARGLLGKDAQVSSEDLLQLVLETGMSTAQEVTQISGRGIGMDVVASEIKQLGGSINLQTTQGKGTRFVIRLPLTLALNQALLLDVAGDLYALPLTGILGVSQVDSAELQRYYVDPEQKYSYAGYNYDIQHLGSLLETGSPRLSNSAQVWPLIMLRSGDQRVALHVEGLVGRREVVVKPVGPQISTVRGISGATILADGRVVMILDAASLLRSLGSAPAAAVEEPAAAGEQPRGVTVMVVDDSITIRKVTQRMLERHEINVVTAKDGVDAVTMLGDFVPDLMLLDIEMPRMDGYEVAAYVRNNDRLQHVPIIMITSRTGDKHRRRAKEIGVNEYLGKPYQETELLEHIDRMLSEAN